MNFLTAWLLVMWLVTLMAPSHYLRQRWSIINRILWHIRESSFIGSAQDIHLSNDTKNDTFKITATSPRNQWINALILNRPTIYFNSLHIMSVRFAAILLAKTQFETRVNEISPPISLHHNNKTIATTVDNSVKETIQCIVLPDNGVTIATV